MFIVLLISWDAVQGCKDTRACWTQGGRSQQVNKGEKRKVGKHRRSASSDGRSASGFTGWIDLSFLTRQDFVAILSDGPTLLIFIPHSERR